MFQTIITPFWNNNEQRLRAAVRIPLTVLAFLLIYRGILFVLNTTGLTLVYSEQTAPELFLVAGLLRLAPAVLALWLAARLLDRRHMADFGFHFNKQWWTDLLFGFTLGICLISFVFIVELACGWLTVSDFFHLSDAHYSFPEVFLIFLVFFIMQSLSEELLIRGYLLKNVAEGLHIKRIGSRWAVFVSWLFISLLFGLLHAGNPNASLISTIGLILTGLTFGAGFVLTGELAIPAGLHISWNFAQATIFGFPLSGISYPAQIVSLIQTEQGGPDNWTGGAFGPEGGWLGLAVSLVGLIAIYGWLYWRRKDKFRAIDCRIAEFQRGK